MNARRLLAVAYKELREVLRDRILLLLTFLMPPMMMLVFIYGMSQDVENVPFMVVDYDRSPMSRDFAYHYIASRYFRFRGYAQSEREAELRMARGDIRLILILPEQFQEQLQSGRPAVVQSLLDGTFSVSARTIQGYVGAVSSAASGELQVEYFARVSGVPLAHAQQMAQPVSMEVRYLYNQDMRAVWTIAPLLIMIILIWVTPLLMALSVVREKETGSIYNMYASTLSRAEFLVGKLLPNVAFSFFNGVVLFLMTTWLYGVPFKGSLPVFALASLLYITATSCFGLLISSLVKVQQAALIITIILAAIVMDQYSGMNTPIADMNPPNYIMAHLFPAMYYTNIVQNAFMKGGGLPELWQDILGLAIYSLAMLGLVHFRFRKRVAA